MKWEEIQSYDDVYPSQMRDLALEVISQATHKCELLKRKGRHFRFCSLKDPSEDAPVSADSPLVRSMVSGLIGICHDNKGQNCSEYRKEIERIREHDERLLEEACKKEGVEYIPPKNAKSNTAQKMCENHCQILGRNYPLKDFKDNGSHKKMPYTFRYGKEFPIICSASVLVVEQTETTRSYLLIQEAKKGAGSIRHDKNKLDLPGGGLVWGETFEQCAIREFEEERGIVPQITGLIGLVERINENNRLIWKAAYTGRITKDASSLIREDSKGFMFFELPVLRLLLGQGMMKTPDIILLVNRLDAGMVMKKEYLGAEESRIVMGWD